MMVTAHLAQLRTVVCRYWCALITTARRESQMSISKNDARRKSLPSTKPKYPGGYVLPEPDLHTLFENNRHDQIEAVAARLQTVADLTGKSLDGKLAKTDLQHLKQLASENLPLDHQRLMRAILQAVTDGPQGLEAARRTAAFLVEKYFLFSHERYLGLKMYEARLRRSRPV